MVYNPDEVEDANPVTRTVLRLHWGLRNLPADLAAVVAIVLLTNVVVFAPIIRETPVRIGFGLVFVLFVPGYAFIAALFPEASTTEPAHDADDQWDDASATPDGLDDQDSGIDGIERVALSCGLSIAITPLIGLILNFTPWGIRLVPILFSLSGFTLLATAVAAYRRWELPIDERFRVPYRGWVAAGRSELLEPDTRADAALNVVLVASILLATSSVAYAVMVPQQGEKFSEFYLLTETDSGDLVADDYPTEMTVGDGHELVVGIGNQEHEETTYTVISRLQRVEIANNSTTVQRSDQLDTFQTTLEHNETWHNRHTVRPTYEGTRLRLLFLLYRGSPPDDPHIDNAYRETHLWVNVTSSGGQ